MADSGWQITHHHQPNGMRSFVVVMSDLRQMLHHLSYINVHRAGIDAT
jgi:hypothetical protein